MDELNISKARYALVWEVKEVVDRREMSAFYVTPLGKVQAKGKGEMEMYFVLASSPERVGADAWSAEGA